MSKSGRQRTGGFQVRERKGKRNKYARKEKL